HKGSAEPLDGGTLEFALGTMDVAYSFAENAYRELLDAGVAPEQARFVLPQGMVTEWVWTGSLYGWYDLYRQRISNHAQWDVRLFAQDIDAMMTKLYPLSWKALKESDNGE
ncbi:MAG: FAD-dependent thymidylate synthase, partial [Cetobacterium sp.]|uniref:FAD-dependent thymidylate synthase n=1 Tax=Cetobacterium sp. TaxID=2071632 RepID=UPI003EE6859C